MDVNTSTLTPLLLSVDEAAALLGIGRSHFYGLHSSGRLGPLPVHLGKRALWRREELLRWVQAGCLGRETWMTMSKDSRERA